MLFRGPRRDRSSEDTGGTVLLIQGLNRIQGVLIWIFTAALVATLGIFSGFIALTIVCGLLGVAAIRIFNGFIDYDWHY